MFSIHTAHRKTNQKFLWEAWHVRLDSVLWSPSAAEYGIFIIVFRLFSRFQDIFHKCRQQLIAIVWLIAFYFHECPIHRPHFIWWRIHPPPTLDACKCIPNSLRSQGYQCCTTYKNDVSSLSILFFSYFHSICLNSWQSMFPSHTIDKIVCNSECSLHCFTFDVSTVLFWLSNKLPSPISNKHN